MKDLFSPEQVVSAYPLTSIAQKNIQTARDSAKNILSGKEDRLLVVVGPCSIHDPNAALEYAAHLKKAMEIYGKELHLIMRVYFEKQRTIGGWKGFINDPYLDSTYAINEGLMMARKLLSDLNALNVPTATEFLDAFTPIYLADFISWGAVGARTTESRVHRELASSFSIPIGFKNNRDGNIRVAVEAIEVARQPHHFFTINAQGKMVFVETAGNPDCHIILRGSTAATNYDARSIEKSLSLLKEKHFPPYVMIDCSHGNSQKLHLNQRDVVNVLSKQIAAGDRSLAGIMLESFLEEGTQPLEKKERLIYGKSITDACLSWEQTLPLFDALAESVVQRRKLVLAGFGK